MEKEQFCSIFVNMEEKVIALLTSFLGDYGKQCGEWFSFNCPCCAEENFGTPDGKYNLEVKVDPHSKGCGGYHCWKCGDSDGTKGTIVNLFKRYAPQDIITEFRELYNDYKQSKRYELSFIGEVDDEFKDEEELSLPIGFKPLKKEDKLAKDAYEYVKSRGIDDRIIEQYNLGYIANSQDYSLRNRVYIPSYDSFNNLTYWVGRDYSGKNKQKAKNAKVAKHSIVFNEGKINWYEPITLVEGPFDHIVVPNSIPLLGKVLNNDSAVLEALIKRSKSDINIFLDDDAINDANRIYKFLNNKAELKGKINLIETPDGYDPSQIYQEFGYKGIIEMLCSSRKLSEYELVMI